MQLVSLLPYAAPQAGSPLLLSSLAAQPGISSYKSLAMALGFPGCMSLKASSQVRLYAPHTCAAASTSA